jgi:hypothetical protein
MSVYKRIDRIYQAKLSARRDEILALERADISVLESGRVIISLMPAYSFPDVNSAKQFITRIIRTRRVK